MQENYANDIVVVVSGPLFAQRVASLAVQNSHTHTRSKRMHTCTYIYTYIHPYIHEVQRALRGLLARVRTAARLWFPTTQWEIEDSIDIQNEWDRDEFIRIVLPFQQIGIYDFNLFHIFHALIFEHQTLTFIAAAAAAALRLTHSLTKLRPIRNECTTCMLVHLYIYMYACVYEHIFMKMCCACIWRLTVCIVWWVLGALVFIKRASCRLLFWKLSAHLALGVACVP